MVIPLLLAVASAQAGIPFSTLEPGVELAVFDAPSKSSHADSKLTLIRIDPTKRTLKLLMASELGHAKLDAPAWAKRHRLSVVANAGMFDAKGDQKTATYFMKSKAHVNNKKIADQNAFLAFDPVDTSVPPVQIIDRRCQDFGELRKKYGSIVQGIRMVDCRQRNRWSRQPKKWSMVVVALDKQGRVLFIFTRSPYRVHDFVEMLLKLPLSIHNMMYLEGGPEASLLVHAGGTVLERIGSYETGFCENDDNDAFWPVPNVIGVPKVGP